MEPTQWLTLLLFNVPLMGQTTRKCREYSGTHVGQPAHVLSGKIVEESGRLSLPLTVFCT
jgi:hypothetical protein